MLKIGWSSRDVSTNEPVSIIGQAFERISTGSLDPTTITVLLIEDGKDSVVFISGDFPHFTSELLREVKEAVAEKTPAVDGNKIILNATHTHTGPNYSQNTDYDKAPKDRVHIYPPEKYRKFLVDNIADAVAEAYNSRSEGSYSFGFGSATVAAQRRSVYHNDKGATNTAEDTFAVNGHAVMYGKTNQEDFSGYEGSTDANVYLLFTFDIHGTLTGAIVNVPCPSQCTEQENFTSADYWNETRELIRAKYGNIYILPQCAAAGDLSPHLLHGMDATARMVRLKYGDLPKAKKFYDSHEYYNRLMIAEKIAAAFDSCYQWASREKITEGPIVHITKKVSLASWKITAEEYENAKASLEKVKTIPFQHTDDPMADFRNNTILSINLNRYENVIARYEEGGQPVDTEIHVLRIGDVAFSTCPYELYLDYQHRIQARSPFTQTFMVQLTAGYGGYVATEKAAKNKGYSAIMFSCNVSPEGGNTLVEETLKELHNMR